MSDAMFELQDFPLKRGPDVSEVSTYDQIEDRGLAVRQLLGELGIPLHRDSALSTLFRRASELANDFRLGNNSHDARAVMLAAEANRVASAILEVGREPAARECLRRMTSGPIDNSVRGPSPGKDALWEIELASYLRSKGISASLGEPDLILRLEDQTYPIACKKVHSEQGVEGQMRKGVQQMERFGKPGLVAFSIDQLTPPSSIFVSADIRTAGDHLAAINRRFLDRHQPKLERFVASGRCDGVLVTLQVVAALENSTPRLNTFSETTIWTLNGNRSRPSTSFYKVVEKLNAARE